MAGFDRAGIEVPVDHGGQDGATISLAVVRCRASSPGNRLGVLLIPPDDPGNSGTHLAARLVPALPDEVTARFDIVGFDHRFSGGSAPLSCGLTQEEYFWVFHRSARFEDELVFQAGIAGKVADALTDVLPRLSSRLIAHDMDLIRQALGEERISVLGYSYGSYLGAVYSQLFGANCDRIVLDSVISPSWVWRGLFLNYAASTEAGLNRWARWAARRQPELALGATAESVRGTYDQLVTRAGSEPLMVRGLPVPFDDGMLRLLTMVMLSSDQTYPLLGDLLRAAVNDGEAGDAVREFVVGAMGAKDESGVIAQLAVLCGDRPWPRDPARYEDDARHYGARYPFMGASMAGVKAGAFWPVTPPDPVTIGPESAAESLLLVHAAHDMFTPPHGARRLHELRPWNSRLVTVTDVAHHKVFPFLGEPSVNDLVTGYLLSGKLPDADVSCSSRTPVMERG